MYRSDSHEDKDYGRRDSYELHTGDPRQDLEYERTRTSSYIVPEEIRRFLTNFNQSIQDRKINQIQYNYEYGFNSLTERYFKTTTWPSPDDVSPIVHDNTLFLTLYKELYFRHIYGLVQKGPTLQQRCDSFMNYCNLFNFILNAETPVMLDLPNQWLWDIIDEFIYQFQAFSQYRSKSVRNMDEREFFRQNAKIWNVHSVLNVLHSLVDKSNINKQLEVYTNGGDPDSVAGSFGSHSLYKNLGYFSLVGLLRLHSLLGDYYQGLKVVENISFNQKTMYSRVAACQITTYYYVGFAYMMMRRYQDAIRTFSNILVYIQHTRQMMTSHSQLHDQIVEKQTDQMYTLLSMCLALHPMKIDDTVRTTLDKRNEDKKNADRMQKLQNGDMEEFNKGFYYACPKFLSPVLPNYDALIDKEPYQVQLKVFQEEVEQQMQLHIIRSYLRLYTTIPIAKLANFMGIAEKELKTHLMCFKHKMKNIVWNRGSSGLNGEFHSSSDLDFYIDKDMIHISDTKVERKLGDTFIRQIHEIDELNRKLKTIGVS